MGASRSLRAVLFDLDGTLVDSAPDLLGALAWLRRRLDLPARDYGGLRHHASRGALGIIEAGFSDQPGLDREQLRARFLDRYAEHYWVESRPFAGVDAMLEHLRSEGLSLAVVTNKVWRLADPLVAAAGWKTLLPCVIGGDTAVRPKPDPAPVLEACLRLGVSPDEALMVGDDIRDIEAGRRAGCRTAAATWGYVAPGEDPRSWGADHLLGQPDEIQEIISVF
ncbi:MAG: HAD-IA family hydrolase [Wenzhouxiangella sp.]|jgi:phosphoglycolate phosphatase|nr:HAD-IA family hydrolase [Wenzhouxiangella sp.]